jgi:hypothetical protein
VYTERLVGGTCFPGSAKAAGGVPPFLSLSLALPLSLSGRPLLEFEEVSQSSNELELEDPSR